MANTFEIKKFSAEIKAVNRKEIKTGCCLEDTDPQSVGKFETLEAAQKELKKEEYKPSCVYRSSAVPFYLVTEYMVECYEADEDGEFVCGSDYDSAYNFEFDEETNNVKVELDKRFA